ncbi:MAG: DcaP family trimeric outer membrane transporter [Burkholderiales bacterium]
MSVFAVVVATGLGISSFDTSAQSLPELNVQIEALQKKLEELDRKQRAAEVESKRKVTEIETKQQANTPAHAVTGGATPGSFKLPGSDTSVTLGGYIKLDAIYNSRSAGVGNNADLALIPNSIPVGPGAGENERGQLKLHARQSRFGIATSTPTQLGNLTTLLETDFFGSDGTETSSNSHGLRIRHAWGTLGSFSAGQYWTNFMNINALPEALDFGGPAGAIFIRQAQVRWTQNIADAEWSVSLENPESSVGVPGTATTFRPDDDRHPDIVGRVAFDTPVGKYWVGTLIRNIRVDSAAAPQSNDSKWGGSLAFSGAIQVFGRDDIKFYAYGGNSIGRYQPLGIFVDGVVDTDGHVSLPRVFGGNVAYRHFWASNIRSTIVLSAARANLPSGTFSGLNEKVQSAHVNLIWSPVKPVDVGVEYIHSGRELADGQSGRLNRIQFSSLFRF